MEIITRDYVEGGGESAPPPPRGLEAKDSGDEFYLLTNIIQLSEYK